MSFRSFIHRSQTHAKYGERNAGTRAAACGALRHLNTAGRRFTPAVGYTAGIEPKSVVTADFNNDGRLDLATANAGDDTSVYCSATATARSSRPSTSATGASPVSSRSATSTRRQARPGDGQRR